MGIVYLAEDTTLNRMVALKLLPPNAPTSENDRARFYREAQVLAALSHPNIAHIYEIDEAEVDADLRLFIVMEYVDETLSHRIKNGPLPIQEAMCIAVQTAGALEAAHEKGIIHRDIKPANIFITKRGRAVILDFGLAKLTGALDLTKSGSTLGTACHCARLFDA